MLRDGVAQEIIDEFARISEIASIHINFTGRSNFKKSTGIVDIEAMARKIEKHLKQEFRK